VRRLFVIVAASIAFGAFASATLGDPPPITIEAPGEAVEATDSAGADVSYHVRSHLDLVVTCTPAGSGTSFDATAHFGIGTSSINCSDTDGNSASGSVTVQDTTPPTVTVPSGATGSTNDPAGTAAVTWPDATATDLVDGALPASCTPASGSTFPVGTTGVTCSATDGHGNTGTNSFAVTVTFSDITAPVIDSHADITEEATSPSGAVATFTLTASDNSGVSPTVNCDHASGSVFALGTTTVVCTATDSAGNTSASTSFGITVQDTLPPTLDLPGSLSVETESSSGVAVSYSATASDVAAGPISPACSPASGANFPVGSSTVNCSADDGHGHTVNGSFTVSVALVDHTAPVLLGLPTNRTVEANGPGGSVVNYTAPTATDNLDGPIAVVGCAPASASAFALGTTNVVCSATDLHGNTGTASFQITVADTVPPSLVVPAPRSVYATSADGISDSDEAITSFVTAASAVDLVDPHPVVTSDIRAVIPIGTTSVNFVARDASGNAVARPVTLTVLPMPPAGTPPLPIPPAATIPQNVRSLKAEAGDRRVRLSWQLPAGIDHVVVARSLTAGGDAQNVYTGKAESFLDRTVVNGLEYRYLVVSVDAAGNASAGVAAVALPKASLLRSPKEGARLKKPPKLVWVRNAEAAYYNVQLYRGDRKIFSAWPNRAALTLKRTWKYERRKYTLTPGTYRWYVWPGFGARSAVDYGESLGFSTFQIVR
jgi:HYR domain